MVTRFLCCADTHSRCPPTSEAIDVRLHAGDVIDGARIGASLYPDPAVVAWFTDESKPTFVVAGNHDVHDAVSAFAGGRDVTGRVVRIADVAGRPSLGSRGRRLADIVGEFFQNGFRS
jgi:DNA repair exonuclease SbcCD nuclease subunit